MMRRGDQHNGLGGASEPVLSGHVDDWAEAAVDYMDGLLAPETKAAVKRHLEDCPKCAARLRVQHEVVTLLRETDLQDPPMDLRERVLGEVALSPKRVSGGQAKDPSNRSTTWSRRLRLWLPATVAVVALVAAVTGYGVLKNPNADLAAEGANSRESVATGQVTETAAEGPQAFGVSTTTGAAPEATAPPTTTNLTGASAPMVASGAPDDGAALTVNPDAMTAELREARVPAYLAFAVPTVEQPDGEGAGETTTSLPDTNAAPVETAGITAKQAAEAASRITALTGLQPLDSSLWLGGPTFAAFLPRTEVEQWIDLVRSIGDSLGLVVGLADAQPDGAAPFDSWLRAHKRELCELVANGGLKPSLTNRTFTTSTLSPAEKSAHDGEWVPPDEAGTHVLVVLYVRNP